MLILTYVLDSIVIEMKATTKVGKVKSLSKIRNKKLKSGENLKKKKMKKNIITKKCNKSFENNMMKKSLKSAKSINNKMHQKKEKHRDTNLQEDIDSLKDTDPEFYEFLKKNDKQLLEFNLLNSSEDDDDDEDDQILFNASTETDYQHLNNNNREDSSDDDDDDDKFHKPSGCLEVASDESDFEADSDDDEADFGGIQKVSINLLRSWQIELQKPNVSIKIIRKVIQAFNSALASISDEEGNINPNVTNYKVVGGAIFNGVIQVCVLHLQSAIMNYLGVAKMDSRHLILTKNKKWKRVRSCLRHYLNDLARLIEQVYSTNILAVLLKHLHQMAIMVVPFSTLGKSILKRLIVLWSTGDETVRILAFLGILKITRNQQGSMLNHVLKAMYMAYVRNSKFVSPNTLPAINFMRRSLVEMFALDLNVSYQHAFLYIRQLAIHLRNGIILKKKDSYQSIYNWQYVNSLRLWAELLGTTSLKPQLQPLIYPLVTITIGVIRLIPTAQYFPLRFHCIQLLINLIKTTNIFIPILPLIVEVLRSKTFNEKHKNVSMKPIQFTCILRLNKMQITENGFRDEVIEQVYSLSLEYLAHESASLGFVELVVPVVVAFKNYLKTCRNANYSRKIKQLIEKIKENSNFIEENRSKVNFSLNDIDQIDAWQSQMISKGTPLNVYYNSWIKTNEIKKRRQAGECNEINYDYGVPKRVIPSKSKSKDSKNADDTVELFPSDSEDEHENVLENIPKMVISDKEAKVITELKPETKQKESKILKKKPNDESSKKESEFDVPLEEPDTDNVDIVKDLDLDDW